MNQYELSYDVETEYFTINDTLNQEIIIIRKEQLEELIKKYCEISGNMII